MFTISEIAKKYRLSNLQVNDLLQFGYLPIAQIDRNHGFGITYLFNEAEIENLDISSCLQEIKEIKQKKPWIARKKVYDFRKTVNVFNYFHRFLDSISAYPEYELLKICFYLFHLNHYAKKPGSPSHELYKLKRQVLKKVCQEYPDLIQLIYLTGPDRKRIQLCEDCKDAANAANMSYISYLRAGNHCPKCFITAIEPEYYSLIEFKIQRENIKFCFHLPRSSAKKWLDFAKLPQFNRQDSRYQDQLYWYGREITRIEEQAIPLAAVTQILQEYVDT